MLGAVLVTPDWLDKFDPPLACDQFALPLHMRICELVIDGWRSGTPATVLSVYRRLQADPDFIAIGGVSYLNRISQDSLSHLSPAANVVELAAVASVRRAQTVLTEALEQLARPGADPSSILDGVTARAVSTSSHLALAYEWAGEVEPVLEDAYLIDDFLPKSGPAVMFGHPGCGKTFLALDLAAHVAEGKPWAGRYVMGGPVLYVVAEGVTGFKNRLTALFNAGRLSRKAPFAYIPTPIDLQAPDGDVSSLIASIRHFTRAAGSPPALVVLDTLSKTFGAGKENTDDMASYVANCEKIAAAFDCLTLIIHHRPRNAEGQNERGHSSLRGGVVASILVEGEETKTALTVKQKDGPENERVSFRLSAVSIGSNSRGKDVTTCLVDIVEVDPDLFASVAPKRVLTGNKRIAFDALETLIALHGEFVPDDIPRECIDRQKVSKVIRSGQAADKLRAEFLGVVKADPDKLSDTARRTAARALTDLKGAGILGSWEEWVWLQ